MVSIVIGCCGFLVTHLFDTAALAGVRKIKPVLWFLGNGLIAYALVSLFLSPDKLDLPGWLSGLGWLLLLISIFFLVHSLFINLPFHKTYVAAGVSNQLIKTGFYALVRHPGVLWFTILMFALVLATRSRMILIAAPIFITLDVILVVVQDSYFFPKMFPGYAAYQKETPRLIPNLNSCQAFINTIKPSNTKIKEEKKMATAGELLRQHKYEELWQKYCGFIDLGLEDIMKIQKRLLMEQLELLNRCELGNHIMKGFKPKTVGEFREKVPLTTYEDYNPFFSKRRKDVLPEKPITWLHTSGRSGEYTKWIPVTERCYQEMGAMCIASLLFGTCQERGEVNVREHDKWLYALAPPPYLSGTWARRVEEEFPLIFLPPLDEAEQMSFTERTQNGIRMAMEEGMDLFGGMPSVLLAVGQRIGEGGGTMKLMSLIRQPKMLIRLLKGVVRSKIARRKLLPKDLWQPKGILAGGADTAIYREKIKEMWGRYPLDMYAFTEGGTIATQTWDYQGMTFVPNLNFLEFIPEGESIKSKQDPTYKPSTVLLDEVKPNQNYELVITNLLGGSLMRYRVGDMIHITSMRNDKLNIDIPQMVFYSRADNIIDIAGFTRLTEKTIWQAIENSGVVYKGWTARKEGKDRPILQVYLEPTTSEYDEEDITQKIHHQLAELDHDYANVESLLGIRPIKVTILPSGAFQNYTVRQQSNGANLGQLKPPHVNPTEVALKYLTSVANVATVSSTRRNQREKVATK